MNKTIGQKINELNKKQHEIELEKEALYPTYFKTEFQHEFFGAFEKEFPKLKGGIKQVIFQTDNIYDDEGGYDLMIIGIKLIDTNDEETETFKDYKKNEINEWVEQYLYEKDIDLISYYIDRMTNPNI